MPSQSHTVPQSVEIAGAPAAGPPDAAPAPRATPSSVVVRTVTPAGEPVLPFANPIRVITHLWRHRHVTLQLTRRELAARYRGSFLGTFWTLLVPLTTLAVYTFVFSVIFRARWSAQDDGQGVFALTLFAGLVPFNLFSEVVAAAPVAVLANPGFVKRVVFPLEVLPLVKLLCALVQAAISAVVLAAGLLVLRGAVPPTIVLMPLAWMPLLLLALGAAYVLAALGVFVRDVGQAVIVLLPFLFFLSPIIYPIDAVPPRFRLFVALNPIAHVVEDCRRVAIFGLPPDWRWFARTLVVGAIATLLGFLFFMKSKRAFHDAL